MYPYRRLLLALLTPARNPIGVFDTHVMPMRCLPQDADIFLELNNGRIQTLYDLGRFRLSKETGFWQTLKDNGWGLAVAGSSMRYRKRIPLFARYELKTRFLGWDNRFFYLEQGMWQGETCMNHGLLRTAVVEKGKAVEPARVGAAMGITDVPPLPEWATAWIDADKARPWPPMQQGDVAAAQRKIA